MRRCIAASGAFLLVAARPAAAFVPLPGVVVDPAGAVVYLMTPGGGIDAVSLERGDLRWSTAGAAKPLALVGRRLVAQAEPPGDGILRLVFLDTRAGKRVLGADVALPRGVRASIDEGLGTSLVATARADGGGVIVSWRAVQRPVGGLAPRPDAPPPARLEEGAARIDVRTGRVETRRPIPDAPARPRTARVRRDESECVVLERAAPAAEVTLACGRPVAQLESADGRHVLVALRAEGERRAQGDYVWSVHVLDDGARVAQLASGWSALPFFVRDSRLVHEVRPSERMVDGALVVEPRALRALDLTSGAVVWSRPLRDPAYRGPYPAR